MHIDTHRVTAEYVTPPTDKSMDKTIYTFDQDYLRKHVRQTQYCLMIIR